MKNISTLAVALLLSLSLFAVTEQPGTIPSLKGIEAAKVFSYASEVWITNPNNVPEYVEFRQNTQIDELNFLPILKKCFALPAGYGATLIRTEQDELGYEHSRYQLTMDGVPVHEGIFLLHMQHGKVIKYNGYIPKNINAASAPSLTESAALHIALTDINAMTYRWQETKDGPVDQTFYPKGELCIVQGHDEIGTASFHLAYKFDIFATAPLSRDYVYVDAQTGAIIRKDNRIQSANTNSTATTVYRGNRAIVADSYNGSYRLRETTRGNGINTKNMRTGTSYTAAVDFTNATTTWNNVNAAKDQYATDAHWSAEMTMDYYLNKHGRNGINGAGFALNLFVHYSTNYVNAYWDGTEMTFGDGNASYSPLTSLDITGHEISHGLTEFTANLNYQNESGAMNEAFSDIMGTAIEWYADSTRANWNVGEDIGTAFRSMSAPKTHQQPNTYLRQYWYAGTQDNGGVHTNSGVENFWYYLLCIGGTGTNDNGNAYNVTGLGRTKASAIAFRMQTVYLVSTSAYTNARFYAIQAATDLYGACSPEVISTANAWYAVGVGAQYSATVLSQFTYSNTVSCSAPFTVNFTNQSNNTSIYTWYFGDGGTSILANPSHTYLTPGVYTVKLRSSGGCGTDSVTKANLVNISSANPCTVVLPAAGVAEVQTSCTGTIYDNGGPNAAYTDNVNSYVTIAPPGAATVRLNFNAFRLEANYDYLYVYDGAGISGTLLGTYTGYTLPASVTSTLPAITVKFVSDGGVVDTGFAIGWTCNAANSPPVAGFKSDVTSTCSGRVQFTDNSTGGVTSWAWNFGDGTTSTLRNPLKTYLTNGTFSVTLVVTNAFGSNTKTITNMITVNKPSAPSVVNGSRCGTGSVVLSATTTNNISWYDSLTSTVALSTSNPFNTPSISATRNYYAEETVPQASVRVGKVDSTNGAGAYFNGNSQRALRFKVNKQSKLVSVFVYALTSGFRTIQYRDTFGVVIASRSIYIQQGRGRINLNIDLVPSANTIYELGVADSMNLFRNSAGGVYPYNDSQGMVSIIGNNISAPAQPGYYYYFYDWEVQAPDCVSLRATATASVGSGLTSTKTSTPVSCYGQATGSASVAVTSGTAPYTYHWAAGPATPSITNLAAGSYAVSMSDNSGCTKVDTVVVTQPLAALSITSTPTGVACFGGTTGAITTAVTGGTSGYSYNWGGSITTPGRTGLGAGTYTVTVTDARNCITTSSTTITQPTAALAVTSTPTSIACFGGTTGAITTAVTGGTSSYTYNWGGSITTPGRTGLAAGTYTVTVTDARNCVTTSSTTITQPAAALAVTSTPTSVACFGGTTGTITTAVTGGTSSYSYNWGGSITTPGRIGLAAGTYTVTVTDARNCITTSSATITQPSAALAVTTTPTSVACFGGTTGAITTVVTGGTSSYSYNWGASITTPGRTGLAAGTYTVTITDARNCVTTSSATITQPAALAVTATPTSVACFGGATGAITTAVTGGTSGYSYNWGGSITTPGRTGLAVGTYTVTITDARNCVTTSSTTITQPAAALAANTTITNISCFGAANGAISTTVTGGTAAYSYNWGGNILTPGRTGLAVGTYIVTVTDARGCTATKSSGITQPAAITIQASGTAASCGQSNGTATASASGGTGTLTYAWPGGVGPSISGLASGNYTVTVTDTRSCTATQGVTVTSPATFTVSHTTTPVSCHGGANGSASVAPSLTPGSYTYTWPGGLSGPTQSALAAGTYVVNVEDANGCSRVDTVVVTEPAAITDALTGTAALCHGSATGSINLQAQGGTGALSYQWAPSISDLNSVPAGTYALTITDANNCTKHDNITIAEGAAITIQNQTTNILCHGAATGSATVMPTGGTGAFTYQWDHSGQGNALTGVTAGTYIVTVRDSNNCAINDTIKITEPATAIQAGATATIAHGGGNDGTATVTATGGTGTLTYVWSTTPAQNSATATGLPTGVYTVTITDGNGCQTTVQATISANVGISEATEITDFSIYPNPATSSIAISVDMPRTSDVRIEIRDMLGRLVTGNSFSNEKQVRTSVDVSSWAAAVYTVQVKTENNTITKQITIQH